MPSGWMIPPAGPRRPSPMEATVAEAVEQAAVGEAAVPIDADLVPDPVPSRTNSNATVAVPVPRSEGQCGRPARSPRLTPTSLTAWTNQTSDRARMHVRGNRPSHVATGHSEDGTGGLMSHVSAPPQWGQSGTCEVLTPCIRHLNSSVHQMYLAPQMCQRDKH